MSVGYLVPTREAVMSGRPEATPLIALAERAERLGYHSVWAGDSLVARPRHEPLTLLTAIAARTDTVMLGTAVLLPVLRHPVVMAHQVATLDRIAEGRLVLGVGIGADAPQIRHEFATAGVGFDRRVGRFVDHLDLCRKLWSGEGVTHHGDFYSVDDITIGPSPHTPGGPPLWVAASTPAGQRRVGRRYDGWLPIGPSLGYADGLATVRSAASDAGRPSESIVASAYLTISLDDDPDAADRNLDEFLASYYPVPPRVMRSLQATFAGRPSDLADWVQTFVDSGARHLILRFAGHHEQHLEACRDSLARFWSPPNGDRLRDQS